MKKLLGLLAVAPMALAACGGSTEVTKSSTDHIQQGTEVEAATTYYLGHGQNNNHTFEQNDSYQVIEVKLWEDENDKIYYVINESVGYHGQTIAADSDALAKPEWTLDDTLADATGKDSGSATDLDGTEDVDGVTIDGSAADADTTYYSNTGESMRYVYDVVEATGYVATTFVAKSRDNYGLPNFDFVTNKNSWQAHLNNNFGTCDKANEVSADTLKEMGRNKGGDKGVSGATASESNLYLAAALTTAQAHCKA